MKLVNKLIGFTTYLSRVTYLEIRLKEEMTLELMTLLKLELQNLMTTEEVDMIEDILSLLEMSHVIQLKCQKHFICLIYLQWKPHSIEVFGKSLRTKLER